MTQIRSQLFAVFAFLSVCLSAQTSFADYICSGDFYPNETLGYGSSGRIRFTTYTGPDCSGSFIQVWNFCTTSPTTGSCIANAAFHYTASEFQTLSQHVREAITWNLRVSVYASGCASGSGSCAAYLEFNAN